MINLNKGFVRFCEIPKKNIFFGGGGGAGQVVGLGGCQGGWDRRIEAFVKIPKKKIWEGGGEGGEGGPIRGWGGGGGVAWFGVGG